MRKADTLATLTNTFYPSWSCLLRNGVKRGGGGGGWGGDVLNGQNLLSMTKIISQYSLNLLTWH